MTPPEGFLAAVEDALDVLPPEVAELAAGRFVRWVANIHLPNTAATTWYLGDGMWGIGVCWPVPRGLTLRQLVAHEMAHVWLNHTNVPPSTPHELERHEIEARLQADEWLAAYALRHRREGLTITDWEEGS